MRELYHCRDIVLCLHSGMELMLLISLAILHVIDLAKWLSYYLYFFFFSFLLDLLHKDEVWESVTCHMSGCHRVTSHDKCKKIINRLYSSCNKVV